MHQVDRGSSVCQAKRQSGSVVSARATGAERQSPLWISAKLPRGVDLLIPVVVLLLIGAPAIFTTKGFIDDWVNHLWLTWMQSREIKATGWPSLFLNAEPMGVFYPNFAFYGGTLYAFGGYLMVLTGTPVGVFVAMILAAFATAYGGSYWIARQAGLSGLASHLPATTVVTGAYYLSVAYGRGSWPELVATSMIPMVVAGALHIVRRGAGTGSVIALAATTVIWSGSHNITFAWGAIFLVAVGVSLVVAWRSRIAQVHLRRMGMVVAVMALGVMVNGWFLLPDVSYALHTQIAQYRAIDPAISGIFSRLSIVFNPFRPRATSSTYLRSHFTELPVLVIVWVVAALFAVWRLGMSKEMRRLAVLLLLVFTGLLLLVVDESAWKHLPATLAVIQFTFRLETYIVLALAGLVILVLVGMRGRQTQGSTNALGVSLAVIVLLGLGLGGWQVWNSTAYYYSPGYLTDRSLVLHYPHHTPPTWYETGQFRDVEDQVVPTDGEVRLNPALVHGESTTQELAVPPGEGPLASNIAASANLVSVSGLRIAGRTAEGFLALERPLDGSSTVRVTVSRADTMPMELGPLVTLIGLLGLVGVAVATQLRSRRRAAA